LQEDNTAVTQKTWMKIPAAKDQRLNASNTAHSNMSPASLRGGFQGSPPLLVGEPHWPPFRAGEQLTTMSFFDALNCIDFIQICVSIWTPFSILSSFALWYLFMPFCFVFPLRFVYVFMHFGVVSVRVSHGKNTHIWRPLRCFGVVLLFYTCVIRCVFVPVKVAYICPIVRSFRFRFCYNGDDFTLVFVTILVSKIESVFDWIIHALGFRFAW
jgi:hypothetical protein